MARIEMEIEGRALTIAKRNQDKMVEETGIQPLLS
jgi:hypothetical protein